MGNPLPLFILRALQSERVEQILRAESESVRFNGCEQAGALFWSGEVSSYLDLGVLMKWAGVFWRNPLVRDDRDLMSVILCALHKACGVDFVNSAFGGVDSGTFDPSVNGGYHHLQREGESRREVGGVCLEHILKLVGGVDEIDVVQK